jgi:hypothetical protein
MARPAVDVGAFLDSAATPTVFNAGYDKLYLQAFVPTKTGILQAFRVLGAEAQTNSTCRMVLFSSTAEGTPLRKLAQGSGGVIVGSEISSLMPNNLPTLDSGETYWVGCECSDNSSEGPVRLLGRAAPEQAYYEVDHVYGDFIPPDWAWPTAERKTGLAFSCFLSLRNTM